MTALKNANFFSRKAPSPLNLHLEPVFYTLHSPESNPLWSPLDSKPVRAHCAIASSLVPNLLWQTSYLPSINGGLSNL